MAEWAGQYQSQYIVWNSVPQEGTVHKKRKAIIVTFGEIRTLLRNKEQGKE